MQAALGFAEIVGELAEHTVLSTTAVSPKNTQQ
jgi:hypothetical protein